MTATNNADAIHAVARPFFDRFGNECTVRIYAVRPLGRVPNRIIHFPFGTPDVKAREAYYFLQLLTKYDPNAELRAYTLDNDPQPMPKGRPVMDEWARHIERRTGLKRLRVGERW